jgi:threonine synthase
MDIQIPSSLERLIYNLEGEASSFYDQLQNEKIANLTEESTVKLQNIFSSLSFDDAMILKEIELFYKNFGWIIDPHTATALSSSVSFSSNLPVVGVATASPEKFSDVISKIIDEFTVENEKNEEKFLVQKANSSLVENTIKEHL